MSSRSLKTETDRWPAALRNATADELENYRQLGEAAVGNSVNARHIECEEWRPSRWCGGKTRSGGARFWFMFGCSPSGNCGRMEHEVTYKVDTLMAVERKISADKGFSSWLFVKSFAKTVLGAVNATLGMEEEAFAMKLLHSNVSPTKAPPISPFWTFICFLNFDYLFLYHLSMALPWLLLDFMPIDDPDYTLIQVAHILVLTLVAIPFLHYPKRSLAFAGGLVFLSQPSLASLAVFCISYLLVKLG